MSTTKKYKRVLCIALALMLISCIVTMLVQTNFGKVTVKELTWETENGYAMSGLLFVPDGASAENKLPAIVTSHGMYNNRGMQDANFVELARRGYVVLAQDMPSHGESDNVPDMGGILTGLYESVKVIADLPYVDVEKIGITGHSLGGMSSNMAVTLDNAAETQLISAVLLNCADATYVDGDGNYTNVYGTRDVGIMAAQYDEFFMQDVDENGNTTLPKDYVKYGNAQSFLYFGTDPSGQELRQADTVYTENIDGEEVMRVIYNPAITHPWAHFSKRATTAVLSFFDQALGAPNPIDPNNQIWQVKEAFNLVGLIGFFMFVISFAILMTRTPFFSSLREKEVVAPRTVTKQGKAWYWVSLAAGAIFGAVTYVPILLGVHSFNDTPEFIAQGSPWGMSMWAAACGLFAIVVMVISYYVQGKKNGMKPSEVGLSISLPKLGKTILLAIIVVCVSFGCVFAAYYFFKADFRIWVLAVKPFKPGILLVSFLPYMILFLIYYIANSVATNCFNYNDIGAKGNRRWWVNTTFTAIGAGLSAVIVLLIQYIPFLAGNDLTWREANMQVVWLFPVVVMLPLAVVVSRKIYRETKNPYLPGIIMGVLVALISCSNTLTYS